MNKEKIGKKYKLKSGEIGHLYEVRFVESKKVKPNEIKVSGKLPEGKLNERENRRNKKGLLDK